MEIYLVQQGEAKSGKEDPEQLSTRFDIVK